MTTKTTKKATLAAATLADPRWQALVARDAAADGQFLYSVRTTGVYCRPSCGARTPRPETAASPASPAEAERAGFRACKRCRPRAAPLARQRAERIAELCRLIDGADRAPSLEALARRA